MRVESDRPLAGSVRLRSMICGISTSCAAIGAVSSPLGSAAAAPGHVAATAAAMERAAGPSAPRVSESTSTSSRPSRSCCFATRFSSSSSREGSAIARVQRGTSRESGWGERPRPCPNWKQVSQMHHTGGSLIDSIASIVGSRLSTLVSVQLHGVSRRSRQPCAPSCRASRRLVSACLHSQRCVASLGAVNSVVYLANSRRCSSPDRLRSPLHLQVSHLVLKSQGFSPRRGVSPSCGTRLLTPPKGVWEGPRAIVHLPRNTRCRFLSPPPCAFLASSPRAWEVCLFLC
eukprot:scaffold5050_cov93-Isochrysis_galbana.AAC.3